MPFCSQCGTQVADRDLYCAHCGGRQAPPAGAGGAAGPGRGAAPGFGPGYAPGFAPGPAPDPLAGISPKAASILCYVPTVGWIAAVVVLASQRFRNQQTVRFHAFQGLYLFAIWLLIEWVLRPVFSHLPDQVLRLDQILQGLILGVWIFMMVKASHEEAYSLPVIGDLAWKSAAEER